MAHWAALVCLYNCQGPVSNCVSSSLSKNSTTMTDHWTTLVSNMINFMVQCSAQAAISWVRTTRQWYHVDKYTEYNAHYWLHCTFILRTCSLYVLVISCTWELWSAFQGYTNKYNYTVFRCMPLVVHNIKTSVLTFSKKSLPGGINLRFVCITSTIFIYINRNYCRLFPLHLL